MSLCIFLTQMAKSRSSKSSLVLRLSILFFEILILFHMLQALIDDGPDMVIREGIEN